MKYIILIAFVIISKFCYSTEQQDDIIIYKGDTCYLDVFPSLIEVYFEKNKNLKYPFQMSSTANYRGHIATWIIENNEIFLTKIEREKKVFKLKKIFKSQIFNDRVKALWFSGYILIKKDFYTIKESSPYGDYEGTGYGFKKYILVKIKDGNIVSENIFDEKIFWNSMDKVHNYAKVNHKDSLIFQEYNKFLNPEHDKYKPDKIYTEKDFKLFLNRKINDSDSIVKIPITYFGIVERADYDKDKIENEFINSNLLINDSVNLFMIQLNNYWLPYGEWSQYSSGSVELIIKLPAKIPDFIVIDSLKSTDYHLINRFVAFKAERIVNGKISLSNLRDTCITINGTIMIRSENPTTFQEVLFNDIIFPIHSIKQYIVRNNPDAKVKDEYEKIERETNEYNGKMKK